MKNIIRRLFLFLFQGREKLPVVKVQEKIEAPDDNRWSFENSSEDSGVFYFRRDILDELKAYFICIRRMKFSHPDAYDLYSKVGATMLPHNTMAATYEFPSYWKNPKNRPGFGCMSFGTCYNAGKTGDDRNCLRLIYYMKNEVPPPTVEPCHVGDVYEYGIYLDEEDEKHRGKLRKIFKKHGCVFHIYVCVMPDMTVRLLKELQTSYEKVTYRHSERHVSGAGASGKRTTNGHKGRKVHSTHHIPHRHWAYPKRALEWFKDTKERFKDDTLENWVSRSMKMLANFSDSSELAVRVSVTDAHGNTAVFSIEWKRTAYFFKDRDTVLNERGKPARIFHVVKPHRRELKDGRELFVRLHFRGLRKFTWNGYQVTITVPGLHHTPINEFTVGVIDADAKMDNIRTIDTRLVGKALARHIEGESLKDILSKSGL